MITSTEKYKKLFLTEADEKITALNTALLGLEKNLTDVNLANDAMRAAHTMKSSAAAMNFMNIAHLCHAMEDLFSAIGGSASGGEQVRSKNHRLEPGAMDLLFEAVDMLSSAVKAIKINKPELDTKEMIGKLENTKTQKQENNTRIKQEDDKSEMLNTKSAPEAFAPIEAIKVDVAVLDRLMNLTEELLVGRMRLNETMRRAEKSPDGKINISELKGISDSFNRLLSDLQFNVVQSRMVPLGQIFERFPRMVRDLAKEHNKEVDFEMKGQEIELDRTIIDRLGEPLIHLLRNAVDHGIGKEGKITLSAERERDMVLVKVENDGNQINWQKVIAAALSKNLIDKSTHDQYLRNISQSGNEILNLKSEIINLLYLGQLSTSEKVTETSGRGVGLSIVKSVTESFGGSVLIESPTSDGGTRFTLQLPLTMAIIQALLVRVGEQTFAVPFSQIDRSVRVPFQNIKKAFDQEVAVVEDEDIPMVRLDKLFGEKRRGGIFLSEEEIQETKHVLKAELIVVTKKEEKQMGLPCRQAGIVIDELLSEQDIVVKPFKGVLKKSKGFAGVTLLGDGRPALILDVATLI